MANIDSLLVSKKLRHRGIYTGKEQSVTGFVKVADGGSIALTDLIRMIPVGENVRPLSVRLWARTTSGTPVLTNPTFNVGVAPLLAGNFTRPNGDVYAPLTADPDALAAALDLTTDEDAVAADIPAPVADSVTNYGPYIVTVTPAGAGDFSVAGGSIALYLEVVYTGEESLDDPLYTQYINPKVTN